MPEVIFRCDADGATGLGHLTRCLDIAALLGAEVPAFRPIFAGHFEGPGREMLGLRGVSVRPLAALSPMVDLAGPDEGRPVVLDSYRLVAQDLETLARSAVRIAVLDDFGTLAATRAHLVMNFRFGARSLGVYSAERTALGPGYFPATRGLQTSRAIRHARAERPEVRNVLLFVGGTDLHNAGPVLAEQAGLAFPEAHIKWFRTQETTGRLPQNVQALPLEATLEGFLADADLVIAGGGRLKYEAAYALTPCASASQTQGQAEDTEALAEGGLCLNLGRTDQLEPAELRRALERARDVQLRSRMRETQERVFPRDASARLVSVLRESLRI